MTSEYSREQFLEKSLPSSPDAERVILGAILLDNDLIAQAIEELDPDDFYSPNNRRIFKAMTGLFERGDRIDPILIGEELKKDGSVDSIGGVATITNLTYGLPHFSSISDYVGTVADKSFVRKIVKAGSEISSFALDDSETAQAVANYAEQKIFDVCNIPSESKPETITALAFASLEKKRLMQQTGAKTAGLSSGLLDVDEKTKGWKRTDLIIIAARPSMGKSSLVAQFASNAAADYKSVVLFFSLEMSKEQLTDRLICSEARIDLARYMNAECSRSEMLTAEAAAEELGNRKIIIDDTPGISPMEMLAKSRRVASENKRLDLIVVDYLQLMSGGKRTESRQQEVSQISRELKAIAKLLDVPIIALSQLSRAPEARNPPRPLMSDLRESGSIEQDADIVAFIYREDYYKPSEENLGIAELIFAKQRNGPTGTVKLAFLKEFTRFENYFGETNYTNPRSWHDGGGDARFA
jgi:replicative DNA helicase